MKAFKQRLQSLENVARIGWEKAHRVVQRSGQSESEAIDTYGRDRLGPHDLLVIRKIVTPTPRAAGSSDPALSIEEEGVQ